MNYQERIFNILTETDKVSLGDTDALLKRLKSGPRTVFRSEKDIKPTKPTGEKSLGDYTTIAPGAKISPEQKAQAKAQAAAYHADPRAGKNRKPI